MFCLLLFLSLAEMDNEAEQQDAQFGDGAETAVDTAAEDENPAFEPHRRTRRPHHHNRDNAEIRDEEHRARRRHRHRKNRSDDLFVIDSPGSSESEVHEQTDAELFDTIDETVNDAAGEEREEGSPEETSEEQEEPDYQEPLEATDGEESEVDHTTAYESRSVPKQEQTSEQKTEQVASKDVPLATPKATRTPKPTKGPVMDAPTPKQMETEKQEIQVQGTKKERRIERSWPSKVPIQGGVPIFVVTLPALHPPVFCRFNMTHAVIGKVLDNGTIMCTVPPYGPGVATLEVSKDKKEWIGNAQVVFVNFDLWGADMFNVFLVILIIGIPLMIAVKFINSVFLRRNKRKKSDDTDEGLDMTQTEPAEKEDKPSRKRRSVI